MRNYAYGWLTAGFFLVSIIGHWAFGWFAFQDEQASHGEVAHLAPYLIQMGRDTFENWQSEFLQLMWQVMGLAYFLYVGSPSSKENDDRSEAKLDEILKLVGGKDGEAIIKRLDEKYLRSAGHAKAHGH